MAKHCNNLLKASSVWLWRTNEPDRWDTWKNAQPENLQKCSFRTEKIDFYEFLKDSKEPIERIKNKQKARIWGDTKEGLAACLWRDSVQGFVIDGVVVFIYFDRSFFICEEACKVFCDSLSTVVIGTSSFPISSNLSIHRIFSYWSLSLYLDNTS